MHLGGASSLCLQSLEFTPLPRKSSVSNLGSLYEEKITKSRLGKLELKFYRDSQPTPRLISSRLICRAASAAKDKKKFSRDELTESQLEKWQEASGVLTGVGFNEEDADSMLGKAFGWVHSPYWTEKLEQTVPDSDSVSSRVDFVKNLGFSAAEVVPVLKKFPEVLGCRESLMEHNLGVLDKDWGIAGKSLKGVIKRNPHVLGYNVDCRGDCMAQCTRCWARF